MHANTKYFTSLTHIYILTYVYVQDTPAWVVSAANYYARAHGKTPFSIYQGRWSVMLRDFEREIIPMARHFGMALAPWGVLGRGKFQSREAVERRRRGEGGEGEKGETLRPIAGTEQTEEEARVSEALCRVAAEHGGVVDENNPTAVALAYVMGKYPLTYPIVGGRKVGQLRDNVKGLGVVLTRAQVEYLDGVLPFDLGFPGNLIGADPKVDGRPTKLLQAGGNINFACSRHSQG